MPSSRRDSRPVSPLSAHALERLKLRPPDSPVSPSSSHGSLRTLYQAHSRDPPPPIPVRRSVRAPEPIDTWAPPVRRKPLPTRAPEPIDTWAPAPRRDPHPAESRPVRPPTSHVSDFQPEPYYPNLEDRQTHAQGLSRTGALGNEYMSSSARVNPNLGARRNRAATLAINSKHEANPHVRFSNILRRSHSTQQTPLRDRPELSNRNHSSRYQNLVHAQRGVNTNKYTGWSRTSDGRRGVDNVVGERSEREVAGEHYGEKQRRGADDGVGNEGSFAERMRDLSISRVGSGGNANGGRKRRKSSLSSRFREIFR